MMPRLFVPFQELSGLLPELGCIEPDMYSISMRTGYAFGTGCQRQSSTPSGVANRARQPIDPT